MNAIRRLYEEIIPSRYNLSIAINRTRRKFFGEVTMEFAARETRSEVTVHAKGLIIKETYIDNRPTAHEYNEETDELTIKSKVDIAKGPHALKVVYEGDINDQMHGMYPCYFEKDGEKKELIATQFESHHAREVFPCVDEPEAKAEFDLTLTTELGVQVLSNTNVKKSHEDDGLLITSFETTPKMSTYLLAWVIGDIHLAEDKTHNGITVRVWATSAQDKLTLDFALQTATNTIDFFEQYFGVKYPLEKCDLVALPDFSSGAMENWGLITFREVCLLVDPLNSSIPMRQMVALVIAHELAHQWFGNLVTMKWWDDLWLNESFATIMEYIAVNNLYPEWKIWLEFSTHETQSALKRDRLKGVQAVRTGVNHPDEINTLFDPSIVYAKGAKLMQLLFGYVGEKAWRVGLKDYFTKHAYGNTSAEDLWQALGRASGREVGVFMIPWIERPGFPMVTLTKRSFNHYDAIQQRFLSDPGDRANDKSEPWPIPLMPSHNITPDLLFSKNESLTSTSAAPLKLNSMDRSLFITHYTDPTHRQEIKRQIIDGKYEEADRLQLLTEASLLASGGVTSQVEALELLAAYQNEDNYVVWQAMSSIIGDTKKIIEQDEELLNKFRRYVNILIERSYGRLGWDKVAGESDFDTILRTQILHLALFGRFKPAIDIGLKRFNDFSKPEEIPSDIRTCIYQAGIKFGGKEAFDKLFALYKKTTFAEEKSNIRSALTSVEDPDLIEDLINQLKIPGFDRPQDFLYWLSGLMANKHSRQLMWTWVQNEWSDWIMKQFSGDKSYDTIPRIVASSFITQKDKDEYTVFFTPKMKEPGLKRNIEVGMADIESRMLWQKRDYPRIRDYLSRH